MTSEEINEAGRRLAKLIGDPPPILECEQDLADYADYVEVDLRLAAMEDRAELGMVRYRLDPSGTVKQWHDRWPRVEQRMKLHEKGTKARKDQGEKSRQEVKRVYRGLQRTNLSAASIVSIIAIRVRLSRKQVRRHLSALDLI
jgi:hypothetical protein